MEFFHLSDNLKRRINFLLECAKHEGTKDQVVTYALRVLSNHATIGRDAPSSTIKKLNKNISNKAFVLLSMNKFDLFSEQTVNEHPKPLLSTWNWLKENSTTLSVGDVWSHFLENPMVTITKLEDAKIRKSGQNHTGDMETRYLQLGISIKVLQETPLMLFKN